MDPRSLAVVGASERTEAIGTRVLKNLRTMGFRGPLYPVNPRYQSVEGLKCWPSLSSLPEKVDAAFLAVPASAGPALVDEAGRCGIRALFLNASGYADGGAQGILLQNRVEALAANYGIVLAGPNNLGLINVHGRKAMWTQQYMPPIAPGPIGVISQSGSIALILLEDQRDLGFAFLVTTGNEAGASVADYLYQMAEDDRVKVILLFLEAVRKPNLFTEAAAEALRRGKQVIALKVGTSEGARALVQAHTGSLAGEDRLYEAYFRGSGIIRVRDLDEMIETATLFCANPTLPATEDVAVVTLSGGEAALISDVSNEIGLNLAPLSAPTLARMRPAFPTYATIANPVDAWGVGFDVVRFQQVVDALLADPRLGTVVFSINAPSRRGHDVPYGQAIAKACISARTGKRIVFINNTAGNGVNGSVRELLDPLDIPYLSGMRAGLSAVRNMISLVGNSTDSRVDCTSMPLIEWPEDEPSRFRLLSDNGVPMVAAETVNDACAAVRAAQGMKRPIALKGVADHLPHKSDLGLVYLDLVDPREIEQAFKALQAELTKHRCFGSKAYVVVQAMADEGVELFVGVRNVPGFGSFLIVGPGGLLVEHKKDVSIRLGPVDESQALAMLAETSAAELLAGLRGRGPWDASAAAAAVSAFSQFGFRFRDVLATLEINPLIVGSAGATGVDILGEPHRNEAWPVDQNEGAC